MVIKKNGLIFFFLFFSILVWAMSFKIAEWMIRETVRQSQTLGLEIITISPLESINTVMITSIYLTIGIILPLIIILGYEWIKDALYMKEKKIMKGVVKWSGITIIGGIIGVVMTYYIIIPFLINYSESLGIKAMSSLQSLLILIAANFMIMSVIFTIPIITKILNKLEIVYKQDLKKIRKYFYLITLILMAIITPTTDAVSLIIMLLPLILIYELSIMMANARINNIMLVAA